MSKSAGNLTSNFSIRSSIVPSSMILSTQCTTLLDIENQYCVGFLHCCWKYSAVTQDGSSREQGNSCSCAAFSAMSGLIHKAFPDRPLTNPPELCVLRSICWRTVFLREPSSDEIICNCKIYCTWKGAQVRRRSHPSHECKQGVG